MSQKSRLHLSVIFLIVANLLPVFGVLLWDWDVFVLLLLFWCENVIIGLFGIAKVAISGTGKFSFQSLFLPVFFTIHYGGFMFGHFMVLIGMYSSDADNMKNIDEPVEYLWAVIERVTWVPIIALVMSHGWSFVTNFLGTDERKILNPSAAMALPYKRMVVTHVALIAGGFFLVSAGEPLVGLLILLGMKVALDVFFHRKEHAGLASISTNS